jgi:hypothetical protein
MHSLFRKKVAGLGAKYPGIKEDVITALITSSFESNWSTSKPLGLQDS